MAVTVKATLGVGQTIQTSGTLNVEKTENPSQPSENYPEQNRYNVDAAVSAIPSFQLGDNVAATSSNPKQATILDVTPKLTVIGIGGAGGNAVNNMIKYNLQGVKFVVANTDAQALQHSNALYKVQLGQATTQGLGAGSRPNVGRSAAEESIDEIMEIIGDSNMIFITAGMGGGTGTGAAPVIAEAARERGILTVGVVTKPFQFEGAHRMRTANEGIEELQAFVDTLIIIPNQNLFRIANEQTTFAEAFKMADDVLYSGVRSVTDLMIIPGLINLDFADIKAVMTEMGKAMMGTGEARGENRGVMAAEAAIANPLLDDISMRGAKGVLISVTGGMDMTLFDVDAAANRIRDEVEIDAANIIFGSTFDESMEGAVRVSVVATGIDQDKYEHYDPSPVLHVVQKPEISPADAYEDIDAALDFTDFSNEEESILDEANEVKEEALALEEEEFILTEEAKEDFCGTDSENTYIRPRGQKRSFFGRLFGKRDVSYEDSSELTIRSTDAEDVDVEEDISDIPACMRRQK